MTTSTPSILETAERLCATLERIGDAMVRVDSATLLETEETLGEVLAALAAGGDLDDKEALERCARRGVAALRRCRRLAASFAGVAGPRLRMRTGLETYGRDGAYQEQAVSGASLRVAT